MKRKQLLQSALALLGLAAVLGSSTAAAQSYPSRAVRIVVPFATGGPADVYARFIAQRLTEALGQSFVVDNKPGGGSVIGTDLAAKAAADGYTLLMMSNTHTVNETLIPNKPFALMKDFVGVAPINYSDLVLVAHPSKGINTLGDLLKRAQAEPGKLNYASSGPGTPYHMAGELLKSMARINMVHVPYKGSSGARTDVIGGQVDLMFDAVTTMTEQVKAGKVKALATTGRARSDVMPEIPTLTEAGVAGYEATIWLGIMAPRGTPQAVVDKIAADVGRALRLPDVVKTLADQGVGVAPGAPAEFDRFIASEIDRLGAVVKTAGIQLD